MRNFRKPDLSAPRYRIKRKNLITDEYMQLKMADIPDEIIKEYKLDQKVTTDGFIYTEIRKGMYGLPQAGIIAQELLAKRLGKHGYSQSEILSSMPYFIYLLSIVECPIISPPLFNEVQRELPLLL